MINKKIIDINCIGCGLCANDNDVEFAMNSEGYYRPSFPLNYDFERLGKKCPIVYEKNEKTNTVWGNYIKVCKAFATESEINRRASSGGVISAVLVWMIDNGKIDGVIQVGVSNDDPLTNRVYLSKSREDVLKCSGSRYAPASPLVNIKEILEKKGKYAFVGKPCDCRALRKYISNSEEFNGEIVMFLSFFCAGTPSKNASKELIAKMGANIETLKKITYRGNGWPGYATVVDDNDTYQMNYEDSWGKVLGRNKQQFCRICPDGVGECADIACGDAWNLTADRVPDFAEADGRNVVFIRSNIGKKVFEKCLNDKYITEEPFEIEDLKCIQPYQYERKTTMISQIVALKIFGKYTPKIPLKNLIILAVKAPKKRLLSVLKGTIVRIKRGDIK